MSHANACAEGGVAIPAEKIAMKASPNAYHDQITLMAYNNSKEIKVDLFDIAPADDVADGLKSAMLFLTTSTTDVRSSGVAQMMKNNDKLWIEFSTAYDQHHHVEPWAHIASLTWQMTSRSRAPMQSPASFISGLLHRVTRFL